MNVEHSLKINLNNFGFVEREVVKGKKIANQCGRDFFYYVLNYYYPELHNKIRGNPQEITRIGLFGILHLPAGLIWTGLTFKNIPKYFRSLGLTLTINGRKISSYFDFLLGIIPVHGISYEKGIAEIRSSIDGGIAVGVDIAMNFGGLVDHVMFVYGYDKDNLYVFDTHQAEGLEYEKITLPTDTRYIMRLPNSIIKERWTVFGRVWVVTK